RRAAEGAGRRAALDDGRVCVERREERGARAGDRGLRLAELRLGRLEGLVGDLDLLDQRGELRIAEGFPPLAAVQLVAGTRDLPVDVRLAIGLRAFHRGAHVVGTSLAAGE